MPETKEGAPLRPQTLGESRVRIAFNPSANQTAEKFKRMVAEFIDACEELNTTLDGREPARLIALAQTHAEDAAMWAVKAATFGK